MWGNRQKVVWSPVEEKFLRENRDTLPLNQLTIELRKSISAIKKKLNEFDGKATKQGKKNKVSYIGFREDLGISVRSSWEANFLRVLNYNKIKWLYEPKAFHFTEVKKGTTSYLPDVYLPELDIYIELKGFLTQKGKTAIRRFRRYYPEEFVKLQMVPGSPNTKAAQFARQMKIPIYTYFNELKTYYKTLINWE